MAPPESYPQHELEERLQFEQLMFNLSARFINIAPDRIDHEIQNALRQILLHICKKPLDSLLFDRQKVI